MSPSEYVAAFASILVGLAVADLATSVHRLARARIRVQWDWIPLAAALFVLLAIMQMWWKSFDTWSGNDVFGFGEFIPILLQLLLAFLLAAAALPDEVPSHGLNLQEYYFSNRRYFWGLFAFYVLVSAVLGVARQTNYFDAPIPEMIVKSWRNIGYIMLMLALMFTRRRWVHGAAVSLMLLASSYGWIRTVAVGD